MEPEGRHEDRLATRLDAQLNIWLSWEGKRDVASDGGLAALLAAAGRLGELREAHPSPEFARSLQAQVLARAESLRTGQASDFATALTVPPPTPYTPDDPATARARPAIAAIRSWSTGVPKAVWPLLAASILLAVGVGTFSAAADAAPGTPLYAIHRTVENAQVQLNSSQDQRVQMHIQFAEEALTAANTAARNGDNSAYATALATLQSETTAATQTLAALPAGTDAQALAKQVDDLQAQSAQELAQDLESSQGRLSWNNRVATTNTLAGLGMAVPRVSSVAITRQDGQSQNNVAVPARVDHIVVSGSGFKAGAKLVANGQMVVDVTVISLAPGQLVANGPRDALDGAPSIGVSNPDGTAAQTSAITRQQDAGNGGDGNGGDNGNSGSNGSGKGPNATATATPTPTPGKDRRP